ncbi:MAG: hypothetical protein IKB34_06210, partial [Clostridia bacterium]|nr:hypothetical protein [Clostridia bacterium]
WFMQSGYHNLPSFGGIDEMQGGRYSSSDEVYDDATGGVKMQLKVAYPEKAGIVSYTRETVLDESATVHITDTVKLAEEKEVDFHFMTCGRPEMIGEGKLALIEGRTMTYDTALKCEIEEFAVNDGGIQKNWKSDVLWRIHFRGVMTEGEFEFTVR